ncbi:DUF4268 domain-containing protein [Humibacillus xanthopallidus]|uniref:Uncharacterized protein DUF4268 n=1 Tax=Humibacillus xanthopallidus TaxID=412689 RepID=A0A543HTW1_9MICO|nr:DUF4268 domain-containing protein [Humibacillus xanthopallidus]TQM61724.1 uncharacterized protein DUF4268 [Humibacillus xanthopallidus]
MQTDVRTPLEIFSMPQHMVVPVFQRRYVWTAEVQWEPLWRDICRVAERRLEGVSSPHFLGAVVTQSSSAGMGSLASHSLIDGQQRLTTLQILIDAAAAELEAAEHTQFSQQLTMLTHNPPAFGLDESGVLKLQHENDDRAGFVAVMTAEPPIDYSGLPQSRIVQAHQYFSEQVREWLGSPVAPARAGALVATLSQGLQLVVIALAEHEPSQEIFETLNARGTPLTAADLVKNYVFQQIVREGGSADAAFREHWQELEKSFWTKEVRIGRYSLERLSLFLNHWLVAQTGEEVSTRSTFTRFKSWHEQSGRPMTGVLAAIHQQATLFEEWVHEAGKSEGDLGPVGLFLYRTEAAELEAVKPLLLRLFDVERALPPDVAVAALRDVESWLMRRSVLRRPASEYSRVVAGLIDDLRGVEPHGVAEAVRHSLVRLNRPGTYWPGDEELARELVSAPIYTQPKGRLRAYLEAVEDWHRGYTKATSASGSRVKRGAMTIEHLLPQKWKDHWPVDTLQQQIDRDAHVHRLGNLTLLTQSLNSAVSNGPWNGPKGKRQALDASDTLLMTRGPRKTEDWNEGRIDDRTATMTTAFTETWPAPEGHNPDPIKRTEQEAAGWVMLRDLVATGHLPVGTILTAREGNYEGRSATVTSDGLLEMDGKTYDTPSGAGKEVLGRAVNGWTFWRLPDGGKLMDARQKYLGTYVDRRGLYESFWREVLARIKKAAPDWTQATSPGGSSWITLPYGSSIARYSLAFTVTGPSVDLDFGSADSQANLVEFERFRARRDELEEHFGRPLTWEPLQDKKSCRIRHYRPSGGQITDTDEREELIDWFVSSALRLRYSISAIRNAAQGQ